MGNFRNYYKAFLTMKQERADYTKPNAGRESLGRCVIEARGKDGRISCYVQDIKPASQYKLFLIAAENGKSTGVCAGAVYVDLKGKGETRFTFNADDVFDSGIAVEKINIAAVLAGPKFELDPVAVLAGYKDEKNTAWRNNFRMSHEKTVSPPEINPEIIIKAKSEAKTETIPKIITESEPEKEQYCEIKAENTKAENNKTENPHEIFKTMAKKFNEEMEALAQYTFSPGSSETLIDKLFAENARMRPFASQKSDIYWVKMSPPDLALFPFDYGNYISHPFIMTAFDSYKHLIIGKTMIEGKLRYILGVPDVYSPEYKKSAADLGFKQFKGCRGILSEGEYGYWLLVI